MDDGVTTGVISGVIVGVSVGVGDVPDGASFIGVAETPKLGVDIDFMVLAPLMGAAFQLNLRFTTALSSRIIEKPFGLKPVTTYFQEGIK